MDQRSIDVLFVGFDDRIGIERNQRELACSGHGVSMAHSGAAWGLEHVRCGSVAAPCGEGASGDPPVLGYPVV